MSTPRGNRRRFLVPEVVQTSAMDCGPAVLKCLLEGYGMPVSYGRLREACQTDVDGTSIDVLEEVAEQLGLVAEQVLVPVNHLLLPEADTLPAVLVVRLPQGFTHFVLVWRRHGPFVQVMDPAVGRRWILGTRLCDEAYVHTHRLAAADWQAWAISADFQLPLGRRLRNLGAGRVGEQLRDNAAEAGWRTLALLDAAVRFVAAGGLRRGREARQALQALFDRAREETGEGLRTIPEPYWAALPAPAEGTEEQILVRGAVLVRIRGRAPHPYPLPLGGEEGKGEGRAVPDRAPDGPTALSPELATALAEAQTRPGRNLLHFLRGDGFLAWLALALGLTLLAGSALLKALLVRGAIDLGRDLGTLEQRLGAIGCFLAFAGALLFLELRVAGHLLRLARCLEGRLRMAFLEKLPRLHDRYFQSRPISDMAERSHTLDQLRSLPRLAGQFVRAALTLVVTGAAIVWIDPAGAPLAVAAVLLALAVPILGLPVLQELDLRVRTHTGALSRFYLDALLGLAAVRAHGAEGALLREQEGLLVEWVHASRRLVRWVVALEGVQLFLGVSLAGWLLLRHAGGTGEGGAVLLLAYWALNLPVLGQEIALLVRQYPFHRSLTLRLLEPLGAPEANPHEGPVSEASAAKDAGQSPGEEPPGLALTFEAMTVQTAGHIVLRDIDLHVPAGSQVAIVGASGAGKSSLVGLLLGWHRAAAGRVLVNGAPLDARLLDRVRDQTAWVDPAVQLWNRTLVENLLYGTADSSPPALGPLLAGADLYDVLQRLPNGLQTALGEGGRFLSAGEGQRVRLGRGLGRPRPRLVLLGEPFRGLDRQQRRDLLLRARQFWQGATLLCITHDVGETRAFERVLVLDAGRLVEDGVPEELAQKEGSRYRALLDAEEAVRSGLWSSRRWRRLRLADGRLLSEDGSG